MASYHDGLEMKLRDIRFGLQDAMDRPNEPLGRKIMDDIQKVEDLAQASRTLRTIENEMHDIMQDLKRSQSASSNEHVISPHDANKFYRKLEVLRNEMRRQPGY